MIDLDWIKVHYKLYNELYFDNILPMCKFEIVYKNTKWVGQSKNSFPEYYKISLNLKYELNETEWQDTLIHEMIHIWQYITNGKGNHGKSFKQKANEINRFGWHITTKYIDNLYNE